MVRAQLGRVKRATQCRGIFHELNRIQSSTATWEALGDADIRKQLQLLARTPLRCGNTHSLESDGISVQPNELVWSIRSDGFGYMCTPMYTEEHVLMSFDTCNHNHVATT